MMSLLYFILHIYFYLFSAGAKEILFIESFNSPWLLLYQHSHSAEFPYTELPHLPQFHFSRFQLPMINYKS
jgi:hypothetical protein